MRYLIIVKATKDSEAGVMPPEHLLAEMAAYHEELAAAGVLVDASGLQRTALGWRIRYAGSKRTVVDGPFAETKELIAALYPDPGKIARGSARMVPPLSESDAGRRRL